MKTTVTHKTTINKAMAKVNTYFDGMTKRSFPKGIRIHNPIKKWDGSKMTFSITVKKGFFISVTTNGSVIVSSKDVTFSLGLPDLIKKFSSEEEIKNFIEKELHELFS
ncbi:hypothetical protein A2V49_01525 [candidate division WWE3 bacterium RBG_19FT_COMBO_34_6]|uniref:Uncharacterized protein n=1 Tax=candidate division WWE3 bacterium RBG_19FT_COMBO_34_6 TaxID=1802612 RepID=A0A1F4UJW9_UNCKA|nr:MAG: hypothetical protein A2V49_01525 [candidate division WWE3 bacterium RBG_19FT_COMBO_34_6]